MTEALLFGLACGTSHSALATSTRHAGADTVPKPRGCYVPDSSQVTSPGCQSTRGWSTTWLSDIQCCQVYSRAKPYWFQCPAARRQCTERGRPSVWRWRCMELDWVAQFGQVSSGASRFESPLRLSTPIVQLSANTMRLLQSPGIPAPCGFRSSPRSLFSSTTSSPKAVRSSPPLSACTKPSLTLTSGRLLSFERWGSSRRSMTISIPVRARCDGLRRMRAVSRDSGEPGTEERREELIPTGSKKSAQARRPGPCAGNSRRSRMACPVRPERRAWLGSAAENIRVRQITCRCRS